LSDLEDIFVGLAFAGCDCHLGYSSNQNNKSNYNKGIIKCGHNLPRRRPNVINFQTKIKPTIKLFPSEPTLNSIKTVAKESSFRRPPSIEQIIITTEETTLTIEEKLS